MKPLWVLGARGQGTGRLAKNIVDGLTQYRENRDGSQSYENKQESILYQILPVSSFRKAFTILVLNLNIGLILLVVVTAFASVGVEPK